MKLILVLTLIFLAACVPRQESFEPKLWELFKSYKLELGSQEKLKQRLSVWKSHGFKIKADYLIGNGLLTYLDKACSYEDTLVYLITPHSGNQYVGGMTLKEYNSSIWALKNMQIKKSPFKDETFKECNKEEILIKTKSPRPEIYAQNAQLSDDLKTIQTIGEKLLNKSDKKNYFYCYSKQQLRNALLTHKLKEIDYTACEGVLASEMDKRFKLADPEVRLDIPLKTDMHSY